MFSKYSALNYWQGPSYIRSRPAPQMPSASMVSQVPISTVSFVSQPSSAQPPPPDIFASLEPYMRQPMQQTLSELSNASLHHLTDLVCRTSNVAANLSNTSPAQVDPFDLYNFIQWVSNLNGTTSKYMWDAAITVSEPASKESVWYTNTPNTPTTFTAPNPAPLPAPSEALFSFARPETQPDAPSARSLPSVAMLLEQQQQADPREVQPSQQQRLRAHPVAAPAAPAGPAACHTMLGGCMYMTGDGNVGINVASPSHQLQLNNDTASKPASFAWNIDADQRLVDDLDMADIDVCYSNIKSMPLRVFKWRDDVYDGATVRDRRVVGWTAEDVAYVFPKAVSTHEAHGLEDCKSMDVSQILASMHGAIQKIQYALEAQEQRLGVIESVSAQPPVVAAQMTHVTGSTEQYDQLADTADDHQLQLDAIKSEIIQLRKTINASLRAGR